MNHLLINIAYDMLIVLLFMRLMVASAKTTLDSWNVNGKANSILIQSTYLIIIANANNLSANFEKVKTLLIKKNPVSCFTTVLMDSSKLNFIEKDTAHVILDTSTNINLDKYKLEYLKQVINKTQNNIFNVITETPV